LTGNCLREFFWSKITYEHKTIDQPITIPADGNELQNFSRILGFIFRYKTENLLKLAKENVAEFMIQYKIGEKYSFPRFQDVFILKK
ncbi:MAG: hypothetical protein Q8O89_05215, partial [Nanoarchaeota archaeon]|nr:hypothetical protein [Nanoarchaeota archaeon]